ncbi:unnamed protein product [Moneuplotes crassus]|uniref:Nuclear migration protein nudC n=1 Tax=Euplotes crassus TaxID=5936 RepID=A0AAD1XNR2_EUPCR|nr:unnamed protein product [Moneuplotes crassus]
MEANIFDNILGNILQKVKEIDNLWDHLFSFMRRNTDFFDSPEEAKSCIFEQFDKHLQKFQSNIKKEHLASVKTEENKLQIVSSVLPNTENCKIEDFFEKVPLRFIPSQNVDSQESEVVQNSDVASKEESDVTLLVGNCLQTDTYSFTQTLSDLTLNAFIPQDTKARDLEVIYTSNSLRVGLKGQVPIFEGELFGKIVTSETL